MARDDMNPTVRPAGRGDVKRIIELTEQARQWALERGHKQAVDPWDLGKLERSVLAGEVYVCADPEPIATFGLRVPDPKLLQQYRFTPPLTVDPEASLMLGQLAVARDRAGVRYGYCVLDKACEVARAWGKSSVYLGCWAGNTKLRAYYSGAGFALVAIGVRLDDENHRIALFRRSC